jgi:3-dehydroquinate synthase
MKSYFEKYDEVFEQKINVPYEYPVYFGHNLLNPENPLIMKVMNRKNENRCHKALVYIDSGVAKAIPDLEAQLEAYFKAWPEHITLSAPPRILQPSDKMENGWKTIHSITEDIDRFHLCRQSYIFAIGGGSHIDIVGLAASLAHRGLRLIRMPTTVLGQNDAGIGVKNAIDQYGAKNFIGTFAPPFAVLNDYSFLAHLSDQGWIDGAAEAFKVAIIKDKHFLDFLCSNAHRFKARNQVAMEKLVHQCAVLHLDHIQTGGDPFEMGSARPLDFGHWSAHKLEVMSNYTITHGQGVSIGVALDSLYAAKIGFITVADATQIAQGLMDSGLPVWHELLLKEDAEGELEVFDGLNKFREHLGGQLCLTLPKPVGKKQEIHEVNFAVMKECIHMLKEIQDSHLRELAV